MSIPEITKKINPYLREKVNLLSLRVKEGFDIKEDIFIILAIILIGLAGFGLGKLSALEKGREVTPVLTAKVENSGPELLVKPDSGTPQTAAAMIAGESAKGMLVASKSGKKYHFPWCAGASQIAEKNKIWFTSYDEAQKAGYTAASNCPGLK